MKRVLFDSGRLCAVIFAAFTLATPISFAAAPAMKDTPFFEVIARDLPTEVTVADIDVAVFLPIEQCIVESRTNWLGQAVALSNEKLLQNWYCRSFLMAAAEPQAKLTYFPIMAPPISTSVSATAEALGVAGGTRRYLALVDWRIDILKNMEAGCMFCFGMVAMTSDIAVFDRQAGRTVWQSIQVNQTSFNKEFEPEKAKYFGPRAVESVLGQMVRLSATLNGAKDGIQSTTATMPGATGAPTLNPAANLMVFNDMKDLGHLRSGYVGNGEQHIQLKDLNPEAQTKTHTFNLYYGNHISLILPEGKYEISRFSKTYAFEVAAGKPAIYLHPELPFLGNAIYLDPVDPAKALNLSQKSVNLLMPEATPASHAVRQTKLQWTSP